MFQKIMDKVFREEKFGNLSVGTIFILNGNGCRKTSDNCYRWLPTCNEALVDNVPADLIVRILVEQ